MRKKELTKEQQINHIMTIEAVKADKIAVEYFENELRLLENEARAVSEIVLARKRERERSRDQILKVLSESDEGLTAKMIGDRCEPVERPSRVVSVINDETLFFSGTVLRLVYKKTIYFILAEKAKAWEEKLMSKE